MTSAGILNYMCLTSFWSGLWAISTTDRVVGMFSENFSNKSSTGVAVWFWIIREFESYSWKWLTIGLAGRVQLRRMLEIYFKRQEEEVMKGEGRGVNRKFRDSGFGSRKLACKISVQKEREDSAFSTRRPRWGLIRNAPRVIVEEVLLLWEG